MTRLFIELYYESSGRSPAISSRLEATFVSIDLFLAALHVLLSTPVAGCRAHVLHWRTHREPRYGCPDGVAICANRTWCNVVLVRSAASSYVEQTKNVCSRSSSIPPSQCNRWWKVLAWFCLLKQLKFTRESRLENQFFILHGPCSLPCSLSTILYFT